MAGRETQASISRWAEETFGPVGSNFRVATRANEEVAELLRAVAADKPAESIIDECADIAIVNARLADRVGIDFFAQLDRYVDVLPHGLVLDGTVEGFAIEAHKSMGHIIDRVLTGNHYDAGVWMGTLARKLVMICILLGGDIFARIDAKMTVNRARVWKLDGDGHGYHVRPGSAAEARA